MGLLTSELASSKGHGHNPEFENEGQVHALVFTSPSVDVNQLAVLSLAVVAFTLVSFHLPRESPLMAGVNVNHWLDVGGGCNLVELGFDRNLVDFE